MHCNDQGAGYHGGPIRVVEGHDPRLHKHECPACTAADAAVAARAAVEQHALHVAEDVSDASVTTTYHKVTTRKVGDVSVYDYFDGVVGVATDSFRVYFDADGRGLRIMSATGVVTLDVLHAANDLGHDYVDVEHG